MCIISFQYKVNSQYDLIVAANRDEFYNRPTKPAFIWDTKPQIIAGQDEQLGGTWIGISENGRFAAVTNYRDPALNELKPISRGKIVTDFLHSIESASSYLIHLQATKEEYGPCNVLLFDGNDFFHYNNIFDEKNLIAPGTYTLSNASLHSIWPKTKQLRSEVSQILLNPNWQKEQLLFALQNKTIAPDYELPSTGVPYEMEKALSAVFIQLPNYGTRSSTIITMNNEKSSFFEQTYENGQPTIQRDFQFSIKKSNIQ